MDQLIDFLQYPFAIRALLASSMVGIMCGILGAFIILRNMALIGDALSHAILPGVVVGFLVAGYSILGFFTGSVMAGLIAAALITWIQRNVATQEDAAIGIVFTSMFALGVMGISWLTHQEGVHLDLKDFLFGNVLGISDNDLWLTFLVMCFTILCILSFYRYFFITTFESVAAKTLGVSVSTIHYFLMLLLSFAVVASLQSVGVILVVAMLVTPASTAYLLTERLSFMVLLSGAIGWLSAALGLLVSIVLQTTPGPAMTIVATLLYLLAVMFAPRKGLISRAIILRRKRQKILSEDILKHSVRLLETRNLTFTSLSAILSRRRSLLHRHIKRLQEKGLMQLSNGTLSLTDEGLEAGYQLIRAHRLWESYLVQEVGLSEDQIHADAEELEHLLPEDLLQEVSRKLGDPRTDPHGSPIPFPRTEQKKFLSSLKPGDQASISFVQADDQVRSHLWELNLSPGEEITVDRVGEQEIVLMSGNRSFTIPRSLSSNVRIVGLSLL